MIRHPELDQIGGIAHGFFTRLDGVSEGIYASRNVGLGSADDRDRVLENRERCVADLATGRLRPRLVTVHQIHSPDAVVVTAPIEPGQAPRADAMVTDRRGLALGVLTADCAPILLAEPKAGIVGAVHAGWKGAVSGVCERTVEAMVRLGADPGRILAVIGPTIGRASYEVGPEFRDRFLADDLANDRYFVPSDREGRFRFDLPAYATMRLDRAGVATVSSVGADTAGEPERFFSYRRATLAGDPDYGRQLSAIAILD